VQSLFFQTPALMRGNMNEMSEEVQRASACAAARVFQLPGVCPARLSARGEFRLPERAAGEEE